jgi:hypothetical protein
MTIAGFSMGIAVFVLWTTNTIISFVFPLLVGALGAILTFGLFNPRQRRLVLVRVALPPRDSWPNP